MIYILLFLFPLSCFAQLDELYVDYVRLFDNGRHAMLNDEYGFNDQHPLNNVALNFNLSEFNGIMFMRNNLHAVSDQQYDSHKGQVRLVGYEFQIGARVTDALELYYHHHSQHWLDHNSRSGFPVEDGVGVRLYLFKNKDQRVYR